MRWLLICLLVSVVALLLAAAGVARHIWIQRRAHSGKNGVPPGPIPHPADETDIEPEL